MEAIILAGGFGTRLQKIIKDIPKPMAEVNGKPFLHYLFRFLNKSSIDRVILSIGYKYGLITDYFKDRYIGIDITYSIEDRPLGTGGAVRKSLEYTCDHDVFVLNGDTLFPIPFDDMLNTKNDNSADVVIGLKKIFNSSRYGTVAINQKGKITDFWEKQYCTEGYINGGVYLLNRSCYLKNSEADHTFSIENDFFSSKVEEIDIFGTPSDAFFIDIGIPEDYEKAKTLINRNENE